LRAKFEWRKTTKRKMTSNNAKRLENCAMKQFIYCHYRHHQTQEIFSGQTHFYNFKSSKNHTSLLIKIKQSMMVNIIDVELLRSLSLLKGFLLEERRLTRLISLPCETQSAKGLPLGA
jgi:hypothetical protein